MKIKKAPTHKNKELKLKLLKTKSYNQVIKVEDILIRLKKAVKIIYRYHFGNKKILFIGSSLELVKKISGLLKSTKHTIIPESSWVNGMLLNKPKKTVKIKSKPKSLKFPRQTQWRRKNELLVILDQVENRSILSESYSAKIPTINFGTDLDILDKEVCFKVPGNFKLNKETINDGYFYSILSATIRRAKIARFNFDKTVEFLRIKQQQKREYSKTFKDKVSKYEYKKNKK